MDKNIDNLIEQTKQEHDDFGSLVKIKKTCKPELARYKARLQRRLDYATNEVDHLPIEGNQLIAKAAKIKAERRLLQGLIAELDLSEALYDSTGVALSDLLKQKKQGKKEVRTAKKSSVIPPE